MWYKHNFYKYASALLLILLILLVFSKISYILVPVAALLATLLIPIIAAVLLYYMLRPLVRILQRLKFPKLLAILTTFLLVIGLTVLFSVYLGSVIAEQASEFVNDISKHSGSIWERLSGLQNNEWLLSQLEQLEQKALQAIENVTIGLTKRIPGFFSTLTSIGTALILTPFILFYLLKDDQRFVASFQKTMPEKYRAVSREIIEEIDAVLSTYISGQLLVALVIGVLMFIGYLVIGMKYPVVLAMFGMITAIIPIFGAFLGIVPAIIVSFTMNPLMILKVVIVMIVVQQVEGNLISPQIMGKRLFIHPLTVILLLISAGSLFGFIGLLIIIPVYAVLRVAIPSITRLYKSLKNEKLYGERI